MSLKHKRGSIQWLGSDTAGATYAVTGLGFSPQAVRLYWGGEGSATNLMSTTKDAHQGGAFFTTPTDRVCVGGTSDDNVATSVCGVSYKTDCAAVAFDAVGSVTAGKLDVQSIDPDGFTMVVDEQLAPTQLTIMFDAWADDETPLQVTILSIAEPAATGLQAYAATGFTATPDNDQVVMAFGGQYSSASDLGNTVAAVSFGISCSFATGTGATEQAVNLCYHEANALGAAGRRHSQHGEFLDAHNRAANNISARSTLSAFLPGQFQVNWLERATTNRRYIYMAIKGGKWKAGTTTLDTRALGNTTNVSGLPFNLEGVLFSGPTLNESANDTSSNTMSMFMGSARSPTDRAAVATRATGSANPTALSVAACYDSIAVTLGTGGSPVQTFDVSSFQADGFTLVTETGVDTDAASFINYLAFGDVVRREVLLGTQLT